MNSKLDELARLIDSWPGLSAVPAADLIDDSLVLSGHLGKAKRVADVGSGGGLPGLPLKIAHPDISLVLIEADQAKAAFLVQACASLGLKDVEVVARRAEEVGQDARYRESFDLVVARAVAPMPVLAELCLPLVKVGGSFMAQKTASESPAPALAAIALLGGELEGVVAAPSAARRSGTVVMVRKVRSTPAAYPRRPGVPARKPLRPEGP
ncbi:MAG TPA: 16S rRNA (guanine(527)-N(7))-methyltransferase RsmG [Patescibacteria group bacterium]|nr:16S rRNA (guanine(527)-N(7))-methyltransferase RsmG [Patescibacteria group bacterium]